MARKNFFFFKNIDFRYLTVLISDNFENNFIFLKRFNLTLFINVKSINLKKINLNTKCINILYF